MGQGCGDGRTGIGAGLRRRTGVRAGAGGWAGIGAGTGETGAGVGIRAEPQARGTMHACPREKGAHAGTTLLQLLFASSLLPSAGRQPFCPTQRTATHDLQLQWLPVMLAMASPTSGEPSPQACPCLPLQAPSLSVRMRCPGFCVPPLPAALPPYRPVLALCRRGASPL